MSVYKYRIYCVTDSTFEFTWAETEPTVCPTNTGHTIDTNQTTIVDELPKNVVTAEIKEEIVTTGGHYRCEGTDLLNCTGNTTTIHDFSWPYRISALNMLWFPTSENLNDIVNVYVGPETLAGAITNFVTASDTVINVQSTVTANAKVGYRLMLDDGTNSEFVYIVSIDSGAGTVTVDPPVTNGYSPLTPTYCKLDVQVCKNVLLPGQYNMVIGEAAIGGSSVPANTVVRVTYENKAADVKILHVCTEYLY